MLASLKIIGKSLGELFKKSYNIRIAIFALLFAISGIFGNLFTLVCFWVLCYVIGKAVWNDYNNNTEDKDIKEPMQKIKKEILSFWNIIWS